MSATACSVESCPCEEYQCHLWVEGRCTCFHESEYHSHPDEEKDQGIPNEKHISRHRMSMSSSLLSLPGTRTVAWNTTVFNSKNNTTSNTNSNTSKPLQYLQLPPEVSPLQFNEQHTISSPSSPQSILSEHSPSFLDAPLSYSSHSYTSSYSSSPSDSQSQSIRQRSLSSEIEFDSTCELSPTSISIPGSIPIHIHIPPVSCVPPPVPIPSAPTSTPQLQLPTVNECIPLCDTSSTSSTHTTTNNKIQSIYQKSMKGYENIALDQSERGIEMLHRITCLTRKLSMATLSYAKLLETILDEEQAMLSKDRDGMGIPHGVWDGMVGDTLDRVAECKIEGEKGMDRVEEGERLGKWGRREIGVLHGLWDGIGRQVDEWEGSVEVSYKSIMGVLVGNGSSGGGNRRRRSSIFGIGRNRNRKSSGSGNSEYKPSGNVVERMQRYYQDIERCNRGVEEYKKGDIQAILERVEGWERQRLEWLVSSAGTHITKDRDIDKDIEQFVSFVNLAVVKDPSLVSNKSTMRDQLPLSVNQVKDMLLVDNSISTSKDRSISLPITVPNTIHMYGHMHIPIELEFGKQLPKPFILCKGLILQLGGLETSGLFRVNGDYEEIQTLFGRLQKKKWKTILPSSVHNAAGLFKLYLRTCFMPILSDEAFASVFELCSQLEHLDTLEKEETSEKSSNFEKDILSQEIVERTKDTIHRDSYRVLQGLVLLLKQISSTQNVVHTLMDCRNLCRIFGPVLVNSTQEVDPIKVFLISKYGSIILEAYMHAMDLKDYPMEEELL